MSVATRCPQCGAAVPESAPQGLCPACLVKVGLDKQSHTKMPLSDPGLAPTLEHTPSGQPAPRVESPLPAAGETFGEYRLLRTLGKGGMGAVYEADDLQSGRRVALKVLKHSLDSPESRKRFLREGRLAASINHPHSVYVYGTEEIEGTPAISMELVPGGTLQELVKQRGPLPVGEAVDAVLQIISGLEAAQALGVLHRDVKPANCFVDVDGKVKVGDFGLSISTAPRGDTDVTQAGAFLGTPAFSSPEQLRGEELNLRSDMYAVGVTLYYLLTGRTPFEADNMVKLLAIVLEKRPESPRKFRPEIPTGLARVILRCLEKQPTDRFRNYAELRDALQPYGSSAPSPATLGLRFLASVVDGVMLNLLIMLVQLLLVRDIDQLTQLHRNNRGLAIGLTIVAFLLHTLWFGVWEGVLGYSPAKALFRLRVVGPDRQPPGIPRASARAAVLYGLATIPAWLQFVVADVERAGWLMVTAQYVVWGLMLSLFATARRSNGYAAWYDLITNTRVIALDSAQARVGERTTDGQLEAARDAERIGPYHVLEPVAKTGDVEWVLAYDTRLLRRVWVRKVPAGTPPVADKLRNLGRIGRLRWLTGVRSSQENWDAFEAATGAALANNRQPRPWRQVRFWLLDLAEELVAAAKDGTLPEQLSLDRVWLTADGRAKLLDFPAPGATKTSPPVAGANEFLRQVAQAALQGTANSEKQSEDGIPALPLPIRARACLATLHTTGSPNAAISELQDLVRQPAEVTHGKRLALVLGCSLPLVMMALFGTLGWFTLQTWQKKHPDIQQLQIYLIALEDLERRGLPGDVTFTEPVTKEEAVAAMEIYIAHRFHRTLHDPAEWESTYSRSSIQGPQRKLAENLRDAHPHVTEEEFQQAEVQIEPLTKTIATAELRAVFMSAVGFFAGIFMVGYLILLAGCSLLAAITVRRGLLLWALGIDIVTNRGQPASRLRLLGRSLLTWSPLFLLPILLSLGLPLLQKLWPDGGPANIVLCASVPLGLYAVLILWSLVLPGRGIPDRLAGTWLVPR